MRNSTIYKLAGPKTFRRSSTKIFKKWGGNLENIEKSMRAIYIPDGLHKDLEHKCKYWLQTGDTSVFTEEELETLRVLLQADQSGAEALIVAYDSTAGDYRQLFIHNVKPHVYVAMKLFLHIWTQKMREKGGVEIDIDTISKTPISKLKLNPHWKELDKLIKDSDNWSLTERYYYLAKQTVHSANYDIQAPMFRGNILEKSGGKILITPNQAEEFLTIYRSLFPEIPERNRRIRRQVDECKLIFNMFGFPYQITNYNITEANYKEYYAWGPQSTVGEITRMAFTDLQNYIWDTKQSWDVLQDNHDSYMSQCKLYEVRECKNKMQEFMGRELTSPIDGTKFNMRSECQVGFCWSPFDKNNPEKCPLGLRELEWIN